MFGTPEILATNDLMVILLFTFFLGLFTGVGRCLFICGPFFVPFAATRSGSNMMGGKMALALGLGRLLAYVLLGLIVSIMGKKITVSAPSPAFIDASYFIVGTLGIYLGISVLLKDGKGPSFFNLCDILDVKKFQGKGYLQVFVLGFTIGWLPCPPLLEILAFTLARGEIVTGTMMLTVFGIGTLLPLLPLGYISGGMSQKIIESKNMDLVNRMSGYTMISFGLYLVVMRNFKSS